MAIPDYQMMMRPTLQAFAEGAENVAQAIPFVAKALGLTDAECEELLPGGRKTVVADRVHWARTYLGKAGCLESPRRNVHRITDRGRALLAAHPDRIDNAVLAQFAEFVEWKARSRGGDEPDAEAAAPAAASAPDATPAPAAGSVPGPAAPPPPPAARTPAEAIDSALAEIEDALAEEVLAAVRSVTDRRFEQLIVDLLRAMGYGGGASDMYRVGRGSGDGGIDGVIYEDALGLDAVYIQAKLYRDPANRVGRPALQAFVGSLTGEGASKGVFVTTSGFSREAQDYLQRVQQRIVLIDGPQLARLMIRHDVGVRTERTIRVKALDAGYFGEG